MRGDIVTGTNPVGLKLKELNRYKKTDKEVIDAIAKFEFYTLCATGCRLISGGFAKAEIVETNKNIFKIKLMWGIQNDCENDVETEFWQMNRITLEVSENF